MEYLLCFATGFLTKLTDWQVDEKLFVYKHFQYVTGFLYGFGAGYLITRSTPLATVVIAVTIGVLLGAKIERRAHQYALAALFLALAFWGVPPIDFVVLGALVAFGFADEALNDFLEGRRVPVLSFVGRHRLLLDLGALGVSIWTGEWAYFLALICFDAGYQLVNLLAPRFLEALPGSQGHHLLLDLYDCAPWLLDDFEFVYRTLELAPGKAGMRALGEPHVVRVKEKRDEGLTGFVFLKESHASVHTYPRFGSAHVDLFSCKEFDSGKVEKWLVKRFKATKSVARTVNRTDER